MIKYFDGAMGTMLNLKAGELPEKLNLTNPEKILAIHNLYASAGADIITANTFGANRLKYKNSSEIVRAGVTLAKQTGKKVALDIGPTGKLLKPFGDLPFEECVDIFAEMVKAGSDADYILLETMGDTLEIKAGMIAAKENSSLPIIVSMIFDEKGRLLTGADIKTACALVEALGAYAIGLNCGLGPKHMIPLVKELKKHSSLPIIVMPNAGLPEAVSGKTVYNVDPITFAKNMVEIAKIGVSFLGGCCGTTPEHIYSMIEATKNIKDVAPKYKTKTIVTSYSEYVDFSEKSIIIGERINPTGKKLLKEALHNHDIDYILREGIAQKDAGADILDVNMGLPGINEAEMLIDSVQSLQSVLSTPLQIDSADPKALEGALRVYNGKPMINSVNGKEESMREVFPLAKKYGGVIICLCLDENGIPSSAEGRIKIAKKIVKTAKEYGIHKKDLIIDALTMTVSTDNQNAIETLKAVNYIKNKLKLHTVLGVSNISFGLPNREAINASFYTLALQAGLSAAIINPNSPAMINAYRSYNALLGLDKNCSEYINSVVKQEKSATPSEITLSDSIIKGIKDDSARLTKLLLQDTAPLDIINNHIIPALDTVGERFEKNTLFLPQLLMSADSAKSAFDEIKKHLTLNEKKSENENTVIIATVEGDIHDIGKNIVKVLLSNYGFNVIDLGKDVKCEAVLDAVLKHSAKLVGLSALMTTTVVNMEKTIDLIHKNSNAKVFVGGAVLTHSYAQKINADWYAKDAMESVRIAQAFFGGSL